MEEVEALNLSNVVLISRKTYDELINREDDLGKVESMKWFMNQIDQKNPTTVKTKILYPYREELEAFVKYPKNLGQPWKFLKRPVQQWIENNPEKVLI